jgi:hypothetical protein
LGRLAKGWILVGRWIRVQDTVKIQKKDQRRVQSDICHMSFKSFLVLCFRHDLLSQRIRRLHCCAVQKIGAKYILTLRLTKRR